MPICAVQLPIVRIFKDFDKMSAKEQQHACRLLATDATNAASNNNNGDDTDDEPIAIKCDAPDCYMSSTEEDNVSTSPKPLRQRKRSTSNLLYKPSKAFSDCHIVVHAHNSCSNAKRANASNEEVCPPSIHHPSKIRHCASPIVNVPPTVGHRDGLRKQLLVRRSPSPSSFSGHRQRLDASPSPSHGGSVCASPGYVQYQMALLEVPMPRDYGDASSDDLSSEWDSDVPEPHRSPKVIFNFHSESFRFRFLSFVSVLFFFAIHLDAKTSHCESRSRMPSRQRRRHAVNV